EAIAGELVAAGADPLHVGFVELDDLRNEQDLAGDAALLQGRLQALVDEPFVGSVLVDDDDAVARLRHDVGLVHLRACGAEPPAQDAGGGGGVCGGAAAGGAPPGNRGLAPSREAGLGGGAGVAGGGPRGGPPPAPRGGRGGGRRRREPGPERRRRGGPAGGGG